ncbi:MAG: 1-acyl-sn-glycerol-3-phosphate acyltransferase [Oscillospiraceae bacterium]|nr:1-acyl-sn-glycerol-3-phosphate acyltransferase [Oscillospiraceae bacterium]
MTPFYKFASIVMRILMPICYKIKVEGKENLPEDGGRLFISNHRSMVDVLIIGIQTPKTPFCILAKQELFKNMFFGFIIRKLGAIAIDRGSGDISPLAELEQRLEQGENALVFPEGTRSFDGKMLRFKTGASLIALQTGAPIVPASIYFEGKLRFRRRITVRFGPEFRFEKVETTEGLPAPAILRAARKEMTQNVAALLPQPETDAEPVQQENKEGESES